MANRPTKPIVRMTPEQQARAEEWLSKFGSRAEKWARALAFKAHRRDEADDLVQEAQLGIIEAAAKWQPGRGAAEWSWTYWYINGRIEHYMRDKAWVIRPPRGNGVPKDFSRWNCVPVVLNGNGQREDILTALGLGGGAGPSGNELHDSVGEVDVHDDGFLGEVEWSVDLERAMSLLTTEEKMVITQTIMREPRVFTDVHACYLRRRARRKLAAALEIELADMERMKNGEAKKVSGKVGNRTRTPRAGDSRRAGRGGRVRHFAGNPSDNSEAADTAVGHAVAAKAAESD